MRAPSPANTIDLRVRRLELTRVADRVDAPRLGGLLLLAHLPNAVGDGVEAARKWNSP